MAKKKSSKEKKVTKHEKATRAQVEQPEEVEQVDEVANQETTEDPHEEKEEGQEVLSAHEKRERDIASARDAVADKGDTVAKKIAESRKSLEQPLQPGQRLFESPEGEIIIGEDSQTQIWSRTMNNGKGGWANPRR